MEVNITGMTDVTGVQNRDRKSAVRALAWVVMVFLCVNYERNGSFQNSYSPHLLSEKILIIELAQI